MENNFFDVEVDPVSTPVKNSKGKENLEVVSNFQNCIDQEIEEYFQKKVNECHQCISKKDYLSLSVKWNTMETLYNMDNISEYITEHIKSNLLRKSTQFKPTSDEKSLIKNKFKDLPQKIVDIREELSEKKDFIQDLIGDLHTETENLEAEGEEESSPEKEEEEVKRNFTNDLPSSKYNINSNPSASKNNNIYLFDEEEEEQEENSETYKSKNKSSSDTYQNIYKSKDSGQDRYDSYRTNSQFKLPTVEEELHSKREVAKKNTQNTMRLAQFEDLPPNPKVQANMKFLNELRDLSRFTMNQ
ncbi:unnamed protein product [Moneuplotes crassus]|uniref:Uncharacterized protein n=1 Tax=Euplotes crassus TaxID=5936 RepID=A0AAD1XLV7_EUPCR|nr:unnamed protein product [Moneuplotes crassus]